MPTIASPRRRAPWADARFAIGVLLVAASVVAVWLVMSSAGRTEPAVVAARTLVPGDVVEADDVILVEASLGAADAHYLEDASTAIGDVAVRVVRAGEIVPADAIASSVDTAVTTIVVPSTTPVPTSVERGSAVELWSAAADPDGGHGMPSILVADAVVARVVEEGGVLGGGGARLELVIPRSDVAAALEALAGGAALSVVPATGQR